MACGMFVLGARDFRLPGLGSYLQAAASTSRSFSTAPISNLRRNDSRRAEGRRVCVGGRVAGGDRLRGRESDPADDDRPANFVELRGRYGSATLCGMTLALALGAWTIPASVKISLNPRLIPPVFVFYLAQLRMLPLDHRMDQPLIVLVVENAGNTSTSPPIAAWCWFLVLLLAIGVT